MTNEAERDADHSPEAVKQGLSTVENIVKERIREGQIVGIDTFTTDEERAAIIELAALYSVNRIGYERRRNELKDLFGATVAAIDDVVKKLVERAQPPALPPPTDDVVNELIVIAKQNAKFWQNSARVGYATFERDAHLEHHKVEGRDFQDFLADKYGEIHQREIDGTLHPMYPSQEDQRKATYQVEAYARRGEEKAPRIRVKHWQDELWIDLGGPNWSRVRVAAGGWKVVPRLEAPLIRGNGMRPLPVPVRGGDIADLRGFANVRDDADFVLLCGMTSINLNPFGNYLTTILCGPAGSGKTTATRLIRGLTDPHEIDTRRVASIRDLMHGAGNTHVVGLENVSSISDELSDAICALNTGSGYAERKYYTQGIEFMTKLHCPVLINGIPSNLAERSDLVDRTVTFVFDYLGEKARSDDMFWRRFGVAAPALFGALLDGASGAMKVRAQFDGDNDEAAESLLDGWRPRFVDAVVWAEAACRSMGFEPGQFTDAYKNNQLVAFRYIGEHHPICVGIKKLIAKQGHWQGYPAELVIAIRPYTHGLDEKVPDAVWLARQLPWVIPVLEKLYEINVTMHKRLVQDDNRNGIIIEKVGVGRGTYFSDRPLAPLAQDQSRAPLVPQPFIRRI